MDKFTLNRTVTNKINAFENLTNGCDKEAWATHFLTLRAQLYDILDGEPIDNLSKNTRTQISSLRSTFFKKFPAEQYPNHLKAYQEIIDPIPKIPLNSSQISQKSFPQK